MNHPQPYKCESEEIFQTKLAILQEYIREGNLDGVLDHCCPTSPVLYHVTENAVYIAESNLSQDPSNFQRLCQNILSTIIEENQGQIPHVHYIYV
jgi:hypothetical protein